MNQGWMIFTWLWLAQLLKLPDGTIKVLVEGGQRAKIIPFSLRTCRRVGLYWLSNRFGMDGSELLIC